jgi:hypothetical protein
MPVFLLSEGLTTIDGLISATCQQLNSYVDLYRSMENLSIDYGVLSDGPPENPCIGRKKRTYECLRCVLQTKR